MIRRHPPPVRHPRHHRSRRPPVPLGERGQATVWVAVAVVLAGALALAVVRAGGTTVDAARARTAADAAALAGAADGREAAVALAAANGGRLASWTVEGVEVEVVVVVGRASARARAGQDGTWCRSEGRPGVGISYTWPPCPSSPG